VRILHNVDGLSVKLVGAENFRDGVFLFFMLIKLSPERSSFVVKTVSAITLIVTK